MERGFSTVKWHFCDSWPSLSNDSLDDSLVSQEEISLSHRHDMRGMSRDMLPQNVSFYNISPSKMPFHAFLRRV